MTDSASLLMLVALQLLLYGIGWAGAALYLTESRHALRDIFGFSIATGLGIALLSLRGFMPDAPSRTIANLCVIGGLLLLWRGAAAMWSLRISRLAMFVVPGMASVIVVWTGFVRPDFPIRVSAFLLAIAWIATLAPISVFKTMRSEFGRWPAWSLVGCGGSVGAVLVKRVVESWWTGAGEELDLTRPGNFGVAVVLLTAISLANFTLGFGVVARMVGRLEYLSRHDGLTGLLNRRALLEAIEQEWQRQRRDATPFALLALDIDHFKRINDRHGHATGDLVLARLGALFREVLRRTDRVGRTGGEEFVVMLVATDGANAQAFAERLRAAVRDCAWPEELQADGGVTVSIGVALSRPDDAGVPAQLARADAALYAAKQGGRDRVVLASAMSFQAARNTA